MNNPIQKQRVLLSAITFAALLIITGPLYASSDHDHDHDHGAGMGDDHHDSAMNKMFLKKKEIDGFDVSFHIMKAKPGKEMGGSHDFMIKVESGGKALTNITMNTKVIHPNGESETKNTMRMGDWLMAGYDLGHEGRHQMMVLFKTIDGKKYKGGFYYSGQ